MKINSQFKTGFIQGTFITVFFFCIYSCNSSPKVEDTKAVAEEHNDGKFGNNKQENDAQFLVDAAEINMEEIQLGQVAQLISGTTHIKELGKMMEVSHAKSLNDLTTLAKKKMITIPTSATDDGQEAYKKLQNKSGIDFDKEYADMMVSGHKEAIAMFEKASTESNDIDIKNWAISTLPVLRTHLDNAINCQKMCEKK